MDGNIGLLLIYLGAFILVMWFGRRITLWYFGLTALQERLDQVEEHLGRMEGNNTEMLCVLNQLLVHTEALVKMMHQQLERDKIRGHLTLN